MSSSSDDLPYFLQSFENLTEHFSSHFGELGSNERGESFLEFARRLLPLSEECQSFPEAQPNTKKSHDDGVDLLAHDPESGDLVLAVQSKYKISEKAKIDGIISKFRDFEEKRKQKQETQGNLFTESRPFHPPHYLIITSSKVENLIKLYESSTLTSRKFYDQLRKEGRLSIIDGPRLFAVLQQKYRKTYLVPADLELISESGWLEQENVYLGVVRGLRLVSLHAKHGDALFFENIRDFVGVQVADESGMHVTVNQEITATIQMTPGKMLARNNGVTFRAETASLAGNTLQLSRANIVNGCQTTMCLVHTNDLSEACHVQVKIVVTDDAWDIAKSSNYQNHVERVDLDLARYFRPQLVRQLATNLGYNLNASGDITATDVINTIYQSKVSYDEVRLFYLGIFSRNPGNLFEPNYAEVRTDILEKIYDDNRDRIDQKIFSVLLLLIKEGRAALERSKETLLETEYAGLYKRFYRMDKPRYRVYLTLVAACVGVQHDISEKPGELERDVAQIRGFLNRVQSLLENHTTEFQRTFFHVITSIVGQVRLSAKTEKEAAQNMYSKIKGMNFSMIYKQVRMAVDAAVAAAKL